MQPSDRNDRGRLPFTEKDSAAPRIVFYPEGTGKENDGLYPILFLMWTEHL